MTDHTFFVQFFCHFYFVNDWLFLKIWKQNYWNWLGELLKTSAVKGFFDIFRARAGQDRPDGIPGSPSCPPTPGRAVGLISERLVNGRGRRARLAQVRSSPLAGASVARCARRHGGLPTGPLRPGRPPGILPEGFQPRAPAVGPCTWTGAAHRAGQCV